MKPYQPSRAYLWHSSASPHTRTCNEAESCSLTIVAEVWSRIKCSVAATVHKVIAFQRKYRMLLKHAKASCMYFRFKRLRSKNYKPKLYKHYGLPFFHAEHFCKLSADGEDSNFITEAGSQDWFKHVYIGSVG